LEPGQHLAGGQWFQRRTPAATAADVSSTCSLITAFSPNSNGIDRSHTINLTGTAEASSTVTVYDGTTNLGTSAVDPSGNWGFSETNARNGTHTFTATDTDMNGTSDASLAFSVTVNIIDQLADN
jgi:large repetitive protein